MAKVQSKLTVALMLWCAALTMGFLGMAIYLVTAVDCGKACQAVAKNKDFEDGHNKTRQHLTPVPLTPNQLHPRKVSPKEGHPEAPRYFRSSDLPIAHLIAVGKLDHSSVNWEFTRRESTLRSMNYSRGSIIVLEMGHYYVYSQAFFAGKNCQAGSEVLGIQIRYQQRSEPSDGAQHPLDLMEAAQTVCEVSNNKPWYHSLRQGGVFLLEKDTRLTVKITPFKWVELEPHRTYFGAFRIQ
ncbi:lymphotoxin-alpha-like [Narcine bancroftii]|uniref:lymphotoxin-alpha-like n=1 Tax=Narcine bancroftii TaxID=1343680 RepID=UPI003831803D